MAKKDEFGDGKTVPVKADDKNFNAAIETITSTLLNPDLNGKNREELINTLKAVLDKFGSQKFNASVENLRTAKKAIRNVELGVMNQRHVNNS